MKTIAYIPFSQADPGEFLEILNDAVLRKHLAAHAVFDNVSVRKWMDQKIQSDSTTGCRVRAITIDGVLAGWCGIQPDDNGFEIAIVLSQRFWGSGISVFKTLMRWARELGHQEIKFHLLETRPEYAFLKRKARAVKKTQLLGRTFTTYYLPVAEQLK
jgi:hypothetical protein